MTVGLGFISAPINHAASLRGDENWLAQQLKNEQTRFVIFCGGRPAIDVSGKVVTVHFVSARYLENFAIAGQPVLLNHDGHNKTVFAVQIDCDLDKPDLGDNVRLINLRSLAGQGVLPVSDLGMLAQARSLLNWHAHHQFCANCGQQTVCEDAGYRRFCQSCKTQHFPRVDPVVIMLVHHNGKYLMGRGRSFSEENYSALAGFIEPGETIEDAARREIFEETGVQVGDISYMMSQPWPFPSSLMIGLIGQALSTDIVLDETELADARWFSVDEIGQMMTGTHPENLSLAGEMSIAWQMMARQLAEPGNEQPD